MSARRSNPPVAGDIGGDPRYCRSPEEQEAR
ncbi:hypothetical protein POX_e06307 [Penicillium oxalicum]|uniref:Uncharacterized protein n=1 Tax=Penicillium oxalicum (strain 114-2 / CGMCC 5302) TaxID=933388 RepID=S7Z9U6_PENO1|nr:hypothetical protein POX_e06307 [Penicillium oxalicum]EPS27335.1 hypothetical protein PDE_02278 [Penicillium oxalicum 114-2]KAI2788293.1 hypothetical protein POX_e06307 [Penicillium oxalicum]